MAVHRDADGELDGYIHYELSWNDDPLGVDTGSGHVHEVWAVDAGAELALWEYVLGIDLVRTVRVDELAPDSVLFAAAADQRAVRLVTRWDEQWLRILDVDAALTARTYGPATPVTIAVAERDGTTRGTWRVAGEGAERSDGATPDVTTDIAGLSAAYLGSTSWWELVATGRATATGPAAIVGADALFASRPLAFCGSFF
ncbi:MAG: sterol carrier protein domain-containing protein [Acidimicrobiales bacterium]